MNYKKINGLRFRQPKSFEYERFFAYYMQNDTYSANEIIIKNTIHKDDAKKINDDNIVNYFNIVSDILDFKDINLVDVYTGKKHKEEYDKLKAENDVIFTIIVESKVAFFKILSRQQLRNAYNLLSDSIYNCWKYISSETFLGGDVEVITNDNYLASCSSASNTFIFQRAETLKKN